MHADFPNSIYLFLLLETILMYTYQHMNAPWNGIWVSKASQFYNMV